MGRERGWEIFSIERTYLYVVAEFKLAKCLVGKVGQGQRLCNCVNSLIFGGIPTGEEEQIGKEL